MRLHLKIQRQLDRLGVKYFTHSDPHSFWINLHWPDLSHSLQYEIDLDCSGESKYNFFLKRGPGGQTIVQQGSLTRENYHLVWSLFNSVDFEYLYSTCGNGGYKRELI